MIKKLGKTSVAILLSLSMISCESKDTVSERWEDVVHLEGDESEEQLYEKAKGEETLKVYTVTTRATKVKESFERTYPGLHVEVKDLRSPDLVEAVKKSVDEKTGEADVVICNDNSGAFRKELVNTGKIVKYLPDDIASNMNNSQSDDVLTFMEEAELLFYNGKKYSECPIGNVWELTEEKYAGKIIMPSPLRSFSTYALCGTILHSDSQLARAYVEYYGEEPKDEGELRIGEIFIERLFANAVFSNSSDEVLELLGAENSSYDFGIMVSSKLRFCDLGYQVKPVWKLEPFCGARISYAVMIAKQAKSINTAKLFIRYMLGGEDGKGEGIRPFQTEGTWSARSDVSDASSIPLAKIPLLVPDSEMLIEQKEAIDTYFTELLKEHRVVE